MRRLARSLLDSSGYLLIKRRFMRYGFDPILDVQRLARRWDRSIDTIFDVGANVGNAATEYLRGFPTATVQAFEPHPATFSRLEGRAAERLLVNNLALGEQAGTVTLHEYGEEGGAALRNSLVHDARSAVQFGYTSREVRVASTTLDLFCAERRIERIGLLKLDVEGFELQVLKGGSRMLWNTDFVYLEFNDIAARDGMSGGALSPVAEHLAEFGFRFCASYTDFLEQEGEFFVVANALFMRWPDQVASAT